MATQTKTTTPPPPLDGADEIIGRIQELNEKITTSLKGAGLAALASYETMLNNLAAYELEISKSGQVDWFTTVVDAHANFVRDTTAAWAKAARGLIA